MMLTAEASVATERSSRYLFQLCRHITLVRQTQPQMRANVEWSDDHGLISFGWGRCTLRAEPGVLTLRAEAVDEASLHQLERRVADRLEQVGRRGRLTVTWAPPRRAEQLPGKLTAADEDSVRARHHGGRPPTGPTTRAEAPPGDSRGETT